MVVAGERFEAAKQYRGSKRAKDNANNKLNILLVRCIFSPSFYNMLVNVYPDHRNHPLKYKLQKFNKNNRRQSSELPNIFIIDICCTYILTDFLSKKQVDF